MKYHNSDKTKLGNISKRWFFGKLKIVLYIKDAQISRQKKCFSHFRLALNSKKLEIKVPKFN